MPQRRPRAPWGTPGEKHATHPPTAGQAAQAAQADLPLAWHSDAIFTSKCIMAWSPCLEVRILCFYAPELTHCHDDWWRWSVFSSPSVFSLSLSPPTTPTPSWLDTLGSILGVGYVLTQCQRTKESLMCWVLVPLHDALISRSRRKVLNSSKRHKCAGGGGTLRWQTISFTCWQFLR